MFREKIKKLDTKNKKTLKIIFVVIVLITVLLDIKFFHNRLLNITLTFEMVIWSILFLIIMAIAGYAVFKSLFKVAAGLSLLIFLAQSYCAVPNRMATSDKALQSLLVLGFIYIAVDFLYSFYKIFIENFKDIITKKEWKSRSDTIWAFLGKFLIIILFLGFTFLLVWNIYQVVGPIILNLCVYK